MKKIYSFLTLIGALTLVQSASAQCVPNTSLTTESITIDPENIGVQCVDVQNNEVISFVAKNSATFNGFPTEFSSLTITSVDNLPAGTMYDCPNDCVFEREVGDFSRGCILISGQPTMVGTFTATINFDVVASGFTAAQSREVEFEILPATDPMCVVNGIESFDIQNGLIVYPNPANSSSVINLDMPSSAQVRMNIYDVIGNEVSNIHNGQLSAGLNSFNFYNTSSLSAGIYLLKVEVDASNGSKSFTKRIIVE